MKTLQSVFAEVPLFQGLDPEYLRLMAGCASNVRFRAGEQIYRHGDPADRFFVIRHGRVALEVHVPQRGAVVIQTLKEGEVLGWSWLVPPYQHHMEARAIHLTRAIAFDGKCLRGKCDEDPRMGYDLMQRFTHQMAKTLRAARLQLLDIYGHPHGE